jgi:hypothetical protein
LHNQSFLLIKNKTVAKAVAKAKATAIAKAKATAIITMTMAAVAGGWWVGWGRAQPNQATNSNEASSSKNNKYSYKLHKLNN